jgi:hypothetical protein
MSVEIRTRGSETDSPSRQRGSLDETIDASGSDELSASSDDENEKF